MTARLSSRHRRKLKEAVSCEKLMAKRKPVVLSGDVAKFPCDCGGLPCDDGCRGDVSLRVRTFNVMVLRRSDIRRIQLQGHKPGKYLDLAEFSSDSWLLP